ncbi:MAG: alternative ribosome rescue aminoacyl-tRNA hydrolase ArfB [bacterium]
MADATGDLRVAPARGLPLGLTVPAAELQERFSRSSGPGGQSVNTADSRVELIFDVAGSSAFDDAQREHVLSALDRRLVDGTLTVAASEHRSQLQNRLAARRRLRQLLADALLPPSPPRRATRPSRGARQRRLDAKRRRGEVKGTRSRVRWDPE